MAERYVVDASVVTQRFIIDTYTQEARALVAQLEQGILLYIPEFCLIESTNVIWKRVRFFNLEEIEAQQLVDELLSLPFQITSVKELLTPALQIGLTYQLAVYDSLYIAMAIVLDCPLITVDNRQAVAARNIGLMLKPITDFVAIE